MNWVYDKWTDFACKHDWNPVSKASEVCTVCGGVRSPEHDPNPCPPRHVEYASQMLAENMVTLHELKDGCTEFRFWKHRDHYHVGHKSKIAGEACKEKNGRQKHGNP